RTRRAPARSATARYFLHLSPKSSVSAPGKRAISHSNSHLRLTSSLYGHRQPTFRRRRAVCLFYLSVWQANSRMTVEPFDFQRRRKRMSTIRIVLANNHKIVRDGLRAVLDAEPDMVVVGEVSEGSQVMEIVE